MGTRDIFSSYLLLQQNKGLEQSNGETTQLFHLRAHTHTHTRFDPWCITPGRLPFCGEAPGGSLGLHSLEGLAYRYTRQITKGLKCSRFLHVHYEGATQDTNDTNSLWNKLAAPANGSFHLCLGFP